MIYVALLRGINVGGNNKVDMKRLKVAFERVGMKNVVTYINSGNIIFEDDFVPSSKLADLLGRVIKEEFGLSIRVLLKDIETMRVILAALPDEWQNDDVMKCDVLFLWQEIDTPKIVGQLAFKDFEQVRYIEGALLWSVERKNASRSSLPKIVGTDMYKRMTIRNCNTARKLLVLMENASIAKSDR
jgi:uncharacterized protein (DUF1697 family)